MSKIQEEKKNTEAAVASAESCEGYNGNPSGASEESGFVGTVVSGGNSNESSPPKAFEEDGKQRRRVKKAEKPKGRHPLPRRRRKGYAARRERRVSSLFIAPSLIGILIFYALPFAVILFYAFVDNPINKEFVFLDNFISLFKNAAFKRAAVNTLKISLTAVPLAVVLSLFLAMALETNIPMKSRFRTFFLSPMMVPAASVVLIWQVLFHHNGAVNDIMSLLGLPGQDWLNSDYAPIVIVVLFLWKNLGYNMIIFMSALANIPRGPLEAAAVDGAGKFRQFVSIKLRYLSPSILFVMIISLINSFKVFREIYLLTGNYAYESLYTLQHYMNNMLRRLDYQKLSAASIVMFLVMVAIVGVLFIIENRFGRDVE